MHKAVKHTLMTLGPNDIPFPQNQGECSEISGAILFGFVSYELYIYIYLVKKSKKEHKPQVFWEALDLTDP